jgi:hypothetical protein
LIKVYVTSGNTYEVKRGVSTDLAGVAPIGEIVIRVYADAGADQQQWLGTFGNVEAAWRDGEVVMTRPPEDAPAGAQAPGPWA